MAQEHDSKRNFATSCLRLRSDVSIEPLAMDDSFWSRIMSGELGSFHNEYLVTVHQQRENWTSWEMHPNGDELVCLLDGHVRFVLEHDGGTKRIELRDGGDFIVVPKGTWHTADVAAPSRMLFITAGEDTRHRERS